MATYLLTWNPDKFAWDQLDAEATALARGETVESRWSCGNTKSIVAGERIFMLRQGRHGRGIVGSGWTVRGTYQDLHWDPTAAARGEKINYVRIRLDSLLQPDSEAILDVHSIESGPLGQVYWGRPASGTRLDDEAAAQLELLWASHIGFSSATPAIDDDLAKLEGQQKVRMVRHRSRERSLRQAKLDAAKRASQDGRLRCEVPGCAFDFEQHYGLLGRDYAQVHHIKPLADFDGPVLVSLSDLAIVCANCHVMIHLGGECRPLANLMKAEEGDRRSV